MAYNRTYTLQEVVEILSASEHRVRPGSKSATGPKGHAISLHTQERKDKLSRPGRLPEVDSTFLVDRNSLSAIVHEALNSSSGQKELERLNHEAGPAEIHSVVLRRGENFDIFVVYRPKGGGQTSFDWASVAKGDGYIIQVYVAVHKIPGSQEIHIQTAYAEDFARTLGDSIERVEPPPGTGHY
jgi:hypothetical protein